MDKDLAHVLFEYTTLSKNTALAYRRHFPPQYTQHMEQSTFHEFQFLALWGQFFDRNWKVKKPIAEQLLQRVDTLDVHSNEDALRACFPYQILRPRCAIDVFYEFYGIA